MVGQKRKENSSTQNSKAKDAKTAKLSLKKSVNNKKLCSETPTTSSRTKRSRTKVIPKYQMKVIEPLDDLITSNGANIVKVFSQFQRGFCKSSTLQLIADQRCIHELRWLNTFKVFAIPDLRVTAIQWHPIYPYLFVWGGKGGALQLLDMYKNSQELGSFPGVGPGGTIEAIRFNTKRSGVEACTASVDGTVSSYNFITNLRHTLVDSLNPTRIWFCSVDVHEDGKSVYAGDNMGSVVIHNLDSHQTNCKLKLHSSKIRHLEFNPRDPNIMVTSSLDCTAKLWDIRKLSDSRHGYVERFDHDNGVTAAKFSLADGCRLLTTDLKNQLRVYRAPSWTLDHQILHPHRHFQHLTLIRASWHPQTDLFVIGRYPDSTLPEYDNIRSIDVFSANSGRLVHEVMGDGRLITSLCDFNLSGELMATTSGKNIFLWKSNRNRQS